MYYIYVFYYIFLYYVDHTKKEQLMDMVAGVQGSRIDDQRANFPGLRGGGATRPPDSRQLVSRLLQTDPGEDGFFDQLMRCQVSTHQQLKAPHCNSESTLPPPDAFPFRRLGAPSAFPAATRSARCLPSPQHGAPGAFPRRRLGALALPSPAGGSEHSRCLTVILINLSL